MKGSIDLNIQTVPSGIPTEMLSAPTYDFDISPSVDAGGSTPIMGLLRGVELDLRTKEPVGRAFGASELFPATFEDGGLAIAAVAGAIIVVALVAGGAYLTFQAQKTMEFGQAVMTPGIQIAEGIAEAIAPAEE